MAMALNDQTLAAVLPGTWHLVATNVPAWLGGKRLEAKVDFELLSRDPLVLAETSSWSLPDGSMRDATGVDTWVEDAFVWRGRGLHRFAPHRWSVAWVSDDFEVALIRHASASADGFDVVVRDGAEPTDLRAALSDHPDRFGLSTERAASLSWLDQHVPGPRS